MLSEAPRSPSSAERRRRELAKLGTPTTTGAGLPPSFGAGPSRGVPYDRHPGEPPLGADLGPEHDGSRVTEPLRAEKRLELHRERERFVLRRALNGITLPITRRPLPLPPLA